MYTSYLLLQYNIIIYDYYDINRAVNINSNVYTVNIRKI